jgi:Aminotransferase class I and II
MPGTVIFSDEKNHASIIAGVRHGRGEKRIWRHNDLEDLEAKLQEFAPDVPKIIAFESVYSMDGHIAPIAAICDLAEKYGALTYLDEVHETIRRVGLQPFEYFQQQFQHLGRRSCVHQMDDLLSISHVLTQCAAHLAREFPDPVWGYYHTRPCRMN